MQLTSAKCESTLSAEETMALKDKEIIKRKLREAFLFSSVRRDALKRARCKFTKKYLCAHCQVHCPRSAMEVDHIVEVSQGTTKKTPLNLWAAAVSERMFDSENVQALCKTCHRSKGYLWGTL